jgi:Holliday junction resolvase RusA-like endonuclease
VTPIRLTITGAPRPRGSHTVAHRADGRAFVRSAGREEAWVARVAEAAQWRASHADALPAPPYVVTLDFYLPWAKRPVHPWPSSLDVDKLARAVLDGLQRGGLLTDDRHVTELHCTKTRATAVGGECVAVTITTAGPETLAA